MVEVKPNNIIWLESLIELIENSVKTFTVPILRRSDEQEFARIAFENPMFVEDAIRRISNSLNKQEMVYDWIAKCTHLESIHQSNAISLCYKGVENGFNGTYFL